MTKYKEVMAMKRNNLTKALAGTLATTLVLGMNLTAFAVTGTATGTGSGTGAGDFEGHVDKDIISVTLPTDNDTSTFAYKLDPEGLIAATEGGNYSDVDFEEGKSVYFLSSTGHYTADSAKLKVINKGTVPVDVTITAKTATNDKVAMADSATFASTDTAAKLYLGLQVANQAEKAVKADDGTSGTVVVGLKGNSANYEIQTDSESTGTKYKYAVKDAVTDNMWNSFEFGLTGACNTNGDWSAADLAGSNVTITWAFAQRASDSTATLLAENAKTEAAPSLTGGVDGNFLAVAGQDITVASLGVGSLAATRVKSFQMNKGGTMVDVTDYEVVGDSVILKATAVDTFLGKSIDSRSYTMVLKRVIGDVTLTFNLVTSLPDKAPIVAASTDVTAQAGTAIKIPVDLGYGELAATGVTSVTFDKNGTTKTVESSGYELADGYFILTAGTVDSFIENATERTYTVTLNDSGSTSFAINLTK